MITIVYCNDIIHNTNVHIYVLFISYTDHGSVNRFLAFHTISVKTAILYQTKRLLTT